MRVADVVEVLEHWAAGRSLRAIAESLGLDRHTVRKYVTPAREAGFEPGTGPPSAGWAAFVARVCPELVRRAHCRSISLCSRARSRDRRAVEVNRPAPSGSGCVDHEPQAPRACRRSALRWRFFLKPRAAPEYHGAPRRSTARRGGPGRLRPARQVDRSADRRDHDPQRVHPGPVVLAAHVCGGGAAHGRRDVAGLPRASVRFLWRRSESNHPRQSQKRSPAPVTCTIRYSTAATLSWPVILAA